MSTTTWEALATEPPLSPADEVAREWLERHGLPNGREEAWRYTPVSDIVDRLADARPAGDAAVTADEIDRWAGRHGTVRIVTVNGVLVPALSDLDALPVDVWVGSSTNMSTTLLEYVTTPAGDPADGFDALNRLAAPDLLHIQVKDDASLDEPIQLVHVSAPGRGATVSHPRVVVDAGARSRFALVESYVGRPGDAITNASTTLRLDPGADVVVHRVQGEADDAVHVGHLGVVQRERSRFRALTFGRGAAISRLALDVTFAGEEAVADLQGLDAPTPGHRHDTVVTVDHAHSRCTSHQRFRAVVADRARTSFSGHVVVRPGTVGTDAHQRNDNLLLSPTAQADSRPWLEIFADDVRCNHGSATGRLDDDAVFYLRSRGIPVAPARAMLVEAFARTVTDAVEPPSLRHHIQARLAPEGS